MFDDLRAAAAVLAGVDPVRLPPAELADRVAELRALIDGLEGLWSRLVRALDGSGAIESGTSSWLRSTCRLSAAGARSRVALARRLADHPLVDEALAGGEISVDHARLVTTALSELAAAAGAELAAATEAPLVAAARRCDPARLRREIAHARHALAPEAAAARDEQLFQQRFLRVATTFDGAVVVDGVLPPEGGEALFTALTSLAAPAGPDDVRSAGQRRADALVELCHRALDGSTLPAVAGERPHLTVLVPVTALPAPAASTVAASAAAPGRTGAAAGPTTDRASGEPTGPTRRHRPESEPAGEGVGALVGGETIWGAVLGPATVRRLACDASLTRVVLGPASQPLDVGRRTRVVPPALRTALVARDRGCVHPGCGRPPPWAAVSLVTSRYGSA